MAGKKAWFKETFGFVEGSSYSKNRAMFHMEGDTLICPTSPHPRQWVGRFETPSLAELRQQLALAAPSGEGGLRFTHLADPVGIVPIIMDERNAGCVIQAASQFNALEMVGPGVSPRQGIAGYANDPTQGPKVALACPAGTVFRNYLCLDGVGQAERQVDCLADVGREDAVEVEPLPRVPAVGLDLHLPEPLLCAREPECAMDSFSTQSAGT